MNAGLPDSIEFDVTEKTNFVMTPNDLKDVAKAMNAKPVFVRQHLTIPNTIYGRWLLKQIKKHFNRKSYEIRVYGRGTKWWVKIRDRIARWHDNPIQRELETAYALCAHPDDLNYKEWEAYVAKLRRKLWGRAGRDRYGIRLRYAARWGVYINKRHK